MDGTLLVLANQTLLVEGQVIRSQTNTMSVFYHSSPEGSMGTFQLHYQCEYKIKVLKTVQLPLPPLKCVIAQVN